MLATLVPALNAMPHQRIVVEGHTDSQGQAAANQALSQRRADAVRDALAAAGVPSARIQSTGVGAARPVADNASTIFFNPAGMVRLKTTTVSQAGQILSVRGRFENDGTTKLEQGQEVPVSGADEGSYHPQGIPGVMANTPPGEAAANIGQNPQQALANGNNAPAQTNNSSRKDSTVNYEVDKSVQYTKSQVGKIERLSAAVVVNFKTITDPKGETRQVPLTPEEITQLDSLVKQAIGFDEQRGDAVNVVNQAFTKVEEASIPMWAQQETMDLAKSLGMPIGIALIAAILVFGLFRPMMKPADVDLFDEGPELLPGQRMPLLANQVGGDNDAELLEQLQREGSLPGMNRQEKMEKLRQLAKEHPQIVASIVKNWVNGETQNG